MATPGRKSGRLLKKALSKFTNDPSNPVDLSDDNNSMEIVQTQQNEEESQNQRCEDDENEGSEDKNENQNSEELKEQLGTEETDSDDEKLSTKFQKLKEDLVNKKQNVSKQLLVYTSKRKTFKGKTAKQKNAKHQKVKSSTIDQPAKFLRSSTKTIIMEETKETISVCMPEKKKQGPIRIFVLHTRTTPTQLFKVIQTLKPKQIEAVKSMGFGSLLQMKMASLPSKLAHYLLDNFDDEKLIISTANRDIEITAELVHQLLGLPMGEITLDALQEHKESETTIKKFKKQYKKLTNLKKTEIAEKITGTTDHGILFKLNFIVLFANSICKSHKSGLCLTNIVNKLVYKVDISLVNWCQFVVDCLKGSKKFWKSFDEKSYYAGPITILVLAYYQKELLKDKDKITFPIMNIFEMEKTNKWIDVESMSIQIDEDIESTKDIKQETTFEDEVFEIQKNIRRLKKYKKSIEGMLSNNLAKYANNKELLNLKKEYDELFVKASNEDANDESNEMSENNEDKNDKDENEGDKDKTTGGNEDANDESDDMNENDEDKNDKDENEGDKDKTTGGNEDVHMQEYQEGYDEGKNGETIEEENNKRENIEEEEYKTQDLGSDDMDLGREEKKDDREEIMEEQVDNNQTDGGKEGEEGKETEHEAIPLLDNKTNDTPPDTENIEVYEDATPTDQPLKSVFSQKPPISPYVIQEFPTIVANIEASMTDEERNQRKYPIVANEAINAIPLSTIDPTLQVPAKRQTKSSAYMCSPYRNRQVIIEQKFQQNELEIIDRIFALFGDTKLPIFKTIDGNFTTRVVMESLIPETWVAANCIDAWSIVLNYEEKWKAPESPSRFYLNVGILTELMLKSDSTNEDLYQEFSTNITSFLQRFKEDKNIRNVDLAYFPVFQNNHYYLVIIHLSRPNVYILDNRKQFPQEYYLGLPNKIVDFFSRYLKDAGHINAEKIEKKVPKPLKTKWQTDGNDQDCAIFVMRHMEMFMGNTKFDSGLTYESKKQQDQLWTLRKKYLAKILLCDVNVNKSIVLAECAEFAKIPKERRDQIKFEAWHRREERMKMI